MWALYCLVQFYNVTHERLQPIKPLAKFISFKAIVFATWWQGVGIVLLCTFRVLPNQEKLQNGLQDFLICIEVVPFLSYNNSVVFFIITSHLYMKLQNVLPTWCSTSIWCERSTPKMDLSTSRDSEISRKGYLGLIPFHSRVINSCSW